MRHSVGVAVGVWVWLRETLGIEPRPCLGKDGSMAGEMTLGLSAHCSSTESEFVSQHSHQAAHKCLYLSLQGDPKPSSGLASFGYLYMCACAHTCIHKNKEL